MFRTPSQTKVNGVDLFADCNKDELRQLEPLLTPIRVTAGTPLIRQGAPANEFVILLDGHAQVTRQVGDTEITVADLGPGSFVGEMGLLHRTPRSATVTAVSDGTVLVSSTAEFRQLVTVAPAVAQRIADTAVIRAANNEAHKALAA